MATSSSSQEGVSSTSHGEADCGQDGTQSFGALAVPAGEAGYLLHERLTWALGVSAPESPDPQLEYDASSGARDISEKPQVGAVNSARADSASRAGGAGRGALRVKAHVLDFHVHRPHREVRDRREQRRLQLDYNVFHGPDCQPSGTDHHPFSGDFAYRPETLSPSLTVATARKLSQNPRIDSECPPLREAPGTPGIRTVRYTPWRCMVPLRG